MICLDITRLASRASRLAFTGIDRVEHAYLRGLLGRDLALFGFARTATGYVVLDRNGLEAFLERIEGRTAWGPPDLEGRLSRRLPLARRRAEADLRRIALDHCLRPGLRRLVRRAIAPGTWFLNVGHSNLSAPVLRAVRTAGARVGVMVHDTIPLDLPEAHRPGMPETFRRRMDAVSRFADLIVCPSRVSADGVRRHLGRDALVAPPGLTATRPDPSALYRICRPDDPYFVCLGTIDERKDQRFLLDLWARLGPERPALYLAGARGWCGRDLARALDNPPPGVVELAGLDDGAAAALLEGATALLHPSRAEGFGFPLLEAAALGVPVIACDLEVYRETLGERGLYLRSRATDDWRRAIDRHVQSQSRGTNRQARFRVRTTWDAHLNLVLSKM